VRAVELKKAEAFGPSVEYLEGMRVFFHERCYPDGSPYTGARRRRIEREASRAVPPKIDLDTSNLIHLEQGRSDAAHVRRLIQLHVKGASCCG
jgi:hypothetical protein